MERLDQGAIIDGLRSMKYANNRCSGIIISASCDIANCKVPKFYYLTALDAKEWILSDVGFFEVFNEKMKQVEDCISETIKKNNLEWESLKSFSIEDALQVIRSECKKPDKVIEKYMEYVNFGKQAAEIEGRKIIAKGHQKIIAEYFIKVSKGEILHFYYLPQKAYKNDETKDKGLIVDLQEIDSIPIEDAERIEKNGIDYLELPKDEVIKERLQKKYWLDTSDDFVIISNRIGSPWREHLMQRFSHGFIRIGIDGATKSDFISLATY